MKIYLIGIAACFLSLLFCACHYGPPLPGINYRGPLPSDSAHFWFADKFSSELAGKTALVFRRVDQATTENEPLASRDVVLVPSDSSPGSVLVMVYTHKMLLEVVISGDLAAPKAQEVAAQVQEMYSRLFPGSRLEPFDRFRGPLGP